MKVFIVTFRTGDVLTDGQIIAVCKTHELARITAREIEEIEEMPNGSILIESFELTEEYDCFDCDRCKDEMRIDDYENGDRYSDDGKMPCPSCQE